MSKHDLKELAAAGMPIGNHGLQHHDWTTARAPTGSSTRSPRAGGCSRS